MGVKTTALEGVLERVQGRQASRFQALIAAVGAGVAVYKLLRSGGDDDDDGEDNGAEDNGAEDDGGGEDSESGEAESGDEQSG